MNIQDVPVIIPAAGKGTRLLPVTRIIPKELFPIYDMPAIQYIFEEIIETGMEEIHLIANSDKEAIFNYFQKPFSATSTHAAVQDRLDRLQQVCNSITLHRCEQAEPRGLGHAIYTAYKAINNRPAAVLLPDDIIDADQPAIAQLIEIYDLSDPAIIIGVTDIPETDLNQYGIIAVKEQLSEDVFSVEQLIEKPNKSEAPSSLGIIGRYLLPPALFPFIEKTKPGAQGEIQLTDAINAACSAGIPVVARYIQGQRFDVGTPEGIAKATINYSPFDQNELLKELLSNISEEELFHLEESIHDTEQ